MIIEYVFQFMGFVIKSLTEVPLSLTVGSAIIVTFIWIFNEIASNLMLWRAAIITVWGTIGLNSIISLRTLGTAELWTIVMVVAIVGTAIARVSKRQFRTKCPNCGAELKN